MSHHLGLLLAYGVTALLLLLEGVLLLHRRRSVRRRLVDPTTDATDGHGFLTNRTP